MDPYGQAKGTIATASTKGSISGRESAKGRLPKGNLLKQQPTRSRRGPVDRLPATHFSLGTKFWVLVLPLGTLPGKRITSKRRLPLVELVERVEEIRNKASVPEQQTW